MFKEPFFIGQWQVIPSRNVLSRNGKETHIEPKAMDVLVRLCAASGEVVSNDDLIKSVWGDRPMGDNPLYKCVAQLRKALGDDQSSPQYIETISRRGYRLVAELKPNDASEPHVDPLAGSRPGANKFALFLFAVVLLAVAAWYLTSRAFDPDSPPESAIATGDQALPAIAVLPFADLSEDEDQAFFAHGMAEELLHKLARNPNLKVIARSSSFSYRPDSTDIKTIAEQLNVSHVLEGSVRKDGDRVRITAQLIDASDSTHIWSETYDAMLEDILELQYDIANRITQTMLPRMGAHIPPRPTNGPAPEPEAYELYLEGRYYLDRFDVEKVELARDRFRRALDIDPGYAAAWAGLADSYTALGYLAVLGPQEAAGMIRAAAERALQLDATQGSAHAALASVLVDYYYEWSAAESHFLQAIEMNPNDATAHQMYAEYLRDMGRFDEALEMIEKAQSLAPLSAFNQLIEGIILDLGRRHDEAIEHYERVLQLNPEFRMTHFYLGLAQAHAGRFHDALARMDRVDPNRLFPDAVSTRGTLLAELGQTEEARAVLAELDALSEKRYVSPFLRAVIILSLGETEEALDLLELTAEERSWFVRLFGIVPGLDPLRNHPRFQDLIESVGLDHVRLPQN